jgi:5,5'-dehydrodivanillate O-demethylase oxygenase subunit
MMGANQERARPTMRDADYQDYAHTGPGKLAGRYLRHFWQPVYVAADLPPGHARPIRVMSEDYTLYRGEGGGVHLVDFRCAHRGTQLSTGWVEGDCIRCFYHGWKYDSTGQCVEQPAEDAAFASKVRIRSYPCEEYLGLVFAYLGEGDAPPLPRYPEFEAEGLLQAGTYTRYCNYFNNIENSADEVHLPFVHRKSGFTDFGLREWDIPRVRAEETDYGMIQYATRADNIERITHFLMPNMIYIKVAPEDAQTDWVDYHLHHRSFNLSLAHVTGEAAERYRERQRQRDARLAELPSPNDLAAAVLRGELRVHDIEDYANIVQVQDTVAQVGQGVIADREHERLGRSDATLILLRRLWARELRALGEGQPLKQWSRRERLAATSGAAST